MYTKEEICDLFNKNYHTQAYKAMVIFYAGYFEKFGYKVTFEKIREELNLPINSDRLYLIYWRARKAKERQKQKEKNFPRQPETRDDLDTRLEKLEKPIGQKKKFDF